MKQIFSFLLLPLMLFSSMAEEIDVLIEKAAPDVHLGIEVVSLEDGKILYQRNGKHLFIPASTTKVFLAAAALDILGSEFQFKTEVFQDKEGNVYVKGSGDPELTSEHLQEMLQNITGAVDIVIDNTCFDQITRGSGWMWDDVGEYWNVPIDGLMVDQGCTKTKECLVGVDSPSKHLGLLAMGMAKAKGRVYHGIVPKEAIFKAKHISSPLSVLLEKVLRNSNNLYSDCIFKKMGGGTWKQGIETMNRYVKEKCGVDPTQLRIVDGSGLSRYNLISPHQFITLLQKNPRLQEIMVTKSGSMTGVRAFVGYIPEKKWAFAVMANGFIQPVSEYRAVFEDEFYKILLRS